jgi:iron complex transport system ATP-binding protein
MSTVRGLGRTVIAALHDLNLAARYCDRVVVLDAGHVVADGPPAETFTPELIRAVFDVEARVLTDGDDRVLAFRQRDTGAVPAPVHAAPAPAAASSTLSVRTPSVPTEVPTESETRS